jgi:hypothetical protein
MRQDRTKDVGELLQAWERAVDKVFDLQAWRSGLGLGSHGVADNRTTLSVMAMATSWPPRSSTARLANVLL